MSLDDILNNAIVYYVGAPKQKEPVTTAQPQSPQVIVNNTSSKLIIDFISIYKQFQDPNADTAKILNGMIKRPYTNPFIDNAKLYMELIYMHNHLILQTTAVKNILELAEKTAKQIGTSVADNPELSKLIKMEYDNINQTGLVMYEKSLKSFEESIKAFGTYLVSESDQQPPPLSPAADKKSHLLFQDVKVVSQSILKGKCITNGNSNGSSKGVSSALVINKMYDEMYKYVLGYFLRIIALLVIYHDVKDVKEETPPTDTTDLCNRIETVIFQANDVRQKFLEALKDGSQNISKLLDNEDHITITLYELFNQSTIEKFYKLEEFQTNETEYLNQTGNDLINNLKIFNERMQSLKDVLSTPDYIARKGRVRTLGLTKESASSDMNKISKLVQETEWAEVLRDYERYKGVVRVYIKIKDYHIFAKDNVSKVLNDELLAFKKENDNRTWKFLKQDISIVNDNSISLIKDTYTAGSKPESFGKFFKVIPPYVSVEKNSEREVKRVTINEVADLFFGVNNLCNVLQNSKSETKICLMTYGYSGSGKTYTLFGKPENKNDGLVELLKTRVESMNGTMIMDEVKVLYGSLELVKDQNKLTDEVINIPFDSQDYDKLSKVMQKDKRKFIKATVNNPDSSRGFTFLKYKINFKHGITHTLLVVDMAGNEDPYDILIKTLPNYRLPYFQDKAKETFLNSTKLTRWEMYSKIAVTEISTILTRILGMMYVPISSMASADTPDILKKYMLPPDQEKPHHITLLSILDLIYPTSVERKYTYFYSERQLGVMCQFLLKNDGFTTNIKLLNYSMYDLTLQTFINLVRTQTFKYNGNIPEDVAKQYNDYLSTNLKIYHSIKTKSTDTVTFLKTLVKQIMDQTLASCTGSKEEKEKFASESLFNVSFETDAKQQKNVKIAMFLNEDLIRTLVLMELQMEFLKDVNYNDLEIHGDISKLPDMFTETDFNNMKRSDITLEDLRTIYDHIINTIDLIYYKNIKQLKTNSAEYEKFYKCIQALCAIKYSIEYHFIENKGTTIDKAEPINLLKFQFPINDTTGSQYQFSRIDAPILKTSLYTYFDKIKKNLSSAAILNNILAINLYDQNKRGIEKPPIPEPPKSSSYKMPKSASMPTSTSMSKHVVKPPDKDVYIKLVKTSEVYKIIASLPELESYFGTAPSYLLKNKTVEPNIKNAVLGESATYFMQIVREGFYINQVNHELVMFLKEYKKFKNTTAAAANSAILSVFNKTSVNTGIPRIPIDVEKLYGSSYNGNKHIMGDNTAMTSHNFKMTQLYKVLYDMLEVKNIQKEDLKFYMICNIIPDIKNRQGAISSLELMNQLSN
jgi:hypothetical protein